MGGGRRRRFCPYRHRWAVARSTAGCAAGAIEDGISAHVHGDVAVVIGRAEAVHVLRVWIREAGRWRIVSEQDVTIQPGATEPSQELLANRHQVPALDSARPSDVADVSRAQDALGRANAMSDLDTFTRLTDADFVVVTNMGLYARGPIA
jgi:hypothetical protein